MKSSLIILLLCSVFIVSCKESLDIQPTDQLSDATVFNTPQTANLFLNDIYNNLNPGPWTAHWQKLPSEMSSDPLDNFSDNSCYGPSAVISGTSFDPGSYGPSNDIFAPNWTKMYSFIRKCNLFIEKVSATSFSDADKKSMIAQARFMRAYFYKSLIDLYGGVPLITKVLSRSSGEDINYPRSTYEECVTFVENECSAAAVDLPLRVTGKDIGRATKGSALAVKNEIELYAGKWNEVVKSSTDIMDLKVYDLFPDYGDLFYTQNENNQEVLFDIQYAANLRPKHINQFWGAVEASTGAGWGAAGPTQDLVDEYEFADGKTVTDGSALYDPQHPYKNRTRRFYASVIYDGCVWRGKTIYTRLGIANNPNEINVVGKAGNAGRTGYFTKKLLDSTFLSGGTNLDGTNIIMFRYAEVLLNYAEAKNEISGPDQSIYDAINKIRKRAGLPNLPDGLDQEGMRKRIRRERRVELAFEGKRLYDLLRWKTANEVFSKPMHGMKITGTGDNLVYQRVEVRNIKFDPSKNYLMPIPQEERDRNPKITQNPGY